MGKVDAWKVLNEGNGRELVLAADFPVTGRPEAGFADLAAGMPPSVGLWETVTPSLRAATEMSGQDYVEHWMQAIPPERNVVTGVVGYCAGSVFAAELVEALSRRQPVRPHLVLFDPEIPTADTLYSQFGKALATLSAVLTTDEVDAVREQAVQARKDAADLEKFSVVLGEVFRVAGRTACERSDIGQVLADELLDTFVSFLTYLAKAAQLDPLGAWRLATAISSNTPENGLNPLPPRQREGLVAREIRYDVQHVDLLRTSAIAAAVTDLLTGRDVTRVAGGGESE